MSSGRQFVTAKRKNDFINKNSRQNSKPINEYNYSNQSSKQQSQTCKKNIASARMKRLRETLKEDLKKSEPPLKKSALQHEVPVSASQTTTNKPNWPNPSSKRPAATAFKNDLYLQSPKKHQNEKKEKDTKSSHISRSIRSSPDRTHSSNQREFQFTLKSQSSTSRPSMNARLAVAAASSSLPLKRSPIQFNNHMQNSFEINARPAVAVAASSSPVPVQSPPNQFNSQMQNSFDTYSNVSSFKFNETDVNIFGANPSNPFIPNSPDTSMPFASQGNSSSQDEYEEMDWSPVSEETLISNIRQVRELYQQEHNQKLNNALNLKARKLNLKQENVYIIVDTNIFIDKLQTIINIMNITYSDNSYPVIYLPWMVIQELDYFKDGYSLSDKHPVSKVIQTRCRKAVKFINDCLIANKPNFQGQSVQLAAQNSNKSQSADDSILASCIQLIDNGYEVILLSSDTNLRNKAMISKVKSFAPTEIVKQLTSLKPMRKRKSFVDELSKKLALICTFVLHFELKQYYGEAEYDKQNFKTLPWGFRDCVKYLGKHFERVFQSRVQKQCRKVVDDLLELFETQDEIVNEVKYMEMCLSLLIYLQTGIPKYDANIQSTIQEIKDLENEFLQR